MSARKNEVQSNCTADRTDYLGLRLTPKDKERIRNAAEKVRPRTTMSALAEAVVLDWIDSFERQQSERRPQAA